MPSARRSSFGQVSLQKDEANSRVAASGVNDRFSPRNGLSERRHSRRYGDAAPDLESRFGNKEEATVRSGSLLTRAVTVAGLAFASAGAATADPTGVWQAKDGGTVRVHSCGQALCGTILTVAPRQDPATGRPWTDKNNADTSKRNRPLIGVQFLTSMRPKGPGIWSGNLYNSDDGNTYSGNVIELGPDTLRIEGCMMGMCGGEKLSRLAR
jgi:uncharacterized protein (DUF2147 family)